VAGCSTPETVFVRIVGRAVTALNVKAFLKKDLLDDSFCSIKNVYKLLNIKVFSSFLSFLSSKKNDLM